ncbi:MAG: methyltransferase domain-containing protein [Rhodobacteraceae bacterium]|nr:MAG: methyltransferase domain-containing protein [Paracoccaceae bacterium]
MGFSAEWLSLREPADHAARDRALALQAVRVAGARPVIVDLGSGTGSTLRALGADMGPGARWHLVDHDANLLAQAAERAGGANMQTHICDLTDLDALPLVDATLVTASALLDLCSEAWLAGLAQRLAARGLPFYAALSYDGVMGWDPADRADGAVVAAFNAHQRGDKGFGPALGPEARAAAGRIFADQGYVLHEADSPWQLGPDQAALQDAFLGGVGDAATEAGAAEARDWLARRRACIAQSACRIGHSDLLAVPPGQAAQALGVV